LEVRATGLLLKPVDLPKNAAKEKLDIVVH
jgi:hypothetical protein